MSKVDEVLDSIGSMTVLELAELKEAFKERFNVEAAAPVAAMPLTTAAASGDSDAASDAGEEQSEFDVILTGGGDKKIQVIKEVRTLTNLGLKDAKDLVDNAPKTILEKASKADADKAKELIEAAGGSIELK